MEHRIRTKSLLLTPLLDDYEFERARIGPKRRGNTYPPSSVHAVSESETHVQVTLDTADTDTVSDSANGAASGHGQSPQTAKEPLESTADLG